MGVALAISETPRDKSRGVKIAIYIFDTPPLFLPPQKGGDIIYIIILHAFDLYKMINNLTIIGKNIQCMEHHASGTIGSRNMVVLGTAPDSKVDVISRLNLPCVDIWVLLVYDCWE